MKGFFPPLRPLVLAFSPFLGGASVALADCNADIDKVEYAVDNHEREGIDITIAEQMRALLEEAYKEHRAGNEAKCQELIDKAKYIGVTRKTIWQKPE